MIVVKAYKGAIEFPKAYKGTQLLYEAGGSLPKEYQQVEYLQSTSNNQGDNYIDTNYCPTPNTSIRFSFMFDGNYPLQDYGRLMGGYNPTFRLEGGSSYTQMTWYVDGLGYRMSYSPMFQLDTLYEAVFSDNVYVNDFQRGTGPMNPDSENLQTSIWLFSSDGGDRDGAYKLYTCQFEENGVLMRDFVPCYRKSDHEPGLYDLVNGVFYTNQGTVPFLVGGNV